MAYKQGNAFKDGTVVTSNLTQNTGTTNTTLTSAQTTVPFLYGAMTEVGFSRLCSITGNNTTHDNAWSSTQGTLQSSTFTGIFNYLSFTSQADGNNLIYTIPTSLTIGGYRVRYRLMLQNNCGIVDFAYNPNSLGYTIIRNQLDCYQASVDNGDGSLQVEDYFSISASQVGTCLLRWIVNGKNAASSNFNLFILDSLQVLKLG